MKGSFVSIRSKGPTFSKSARKCYIKRMCGGFAKLSEPRVPQTFFTHLSGRLGSRGNALMLHFQGFDVSLDFLVLFYQEKRTKSNKEDIIALMGNVDGRFIANFN